MISNHEFFSNSKFKNGKKEKNLLKLLYVKHKYRCIFRILLRSASSTALRWSVSFETISPFFKSDQSWRLKFVPLVPSLILKLIINNTLKLSFGTPFKKFLQLWLVKGLASLILFEFYKNKKKFSLQVFWKNCPTLRKLRKHLLNWKTHSIKW
jgi:hypothetical protein